MRTIEYNDSVFLVINELDFDSCNGCYFYKSHEKKEEDQCSLKSGVMTNFEYRCGSDPIIYKESIKSILKKL